MAERVEQKIHNVDHELFAKAKELIPGGVNSPVRSFNAVGGDPLFIKQAKGPMIYSESGRGFIDYCLSWGALILGHANNEIVENLHKAIEKGTSFGTVTKHEIELAELIVDAITSIEKVRLTSSGTEAVMGAIRLARAYTKRNKVIKFEGAYHGHADYLLVSSGSGVATLGKPDSSGVPEDFTKNTIVLPFNRIDRLEAVLKKDTHGVSAIIVEPVQANCGVVLPQAGFLEGLRDLADRYGTLLIFDEVITGFRASYGGAQSLFNVKPDITCLGKIIGGGLPVGAFGGRKEIMELLAPEGDVYQAGTLSGNPVAVSAGIASLKMLRDKNPYKNLRETTKELCDGIEKIAKGYNVELKVNYIESMFSVFFTDKNVIDFETAKKQDEKVFAKFFHGLLEEGVYFSPSGFETNFLSTAHSVDDIERTVKAISKAFEKIRRK